MRPKLLTSEEFKQLMENNKVIKVEYYPEYVNTEDDYKPTEIVFYLDNNTKIEMTHLEHYISIWSYNE